MRLTRIFLIVLTLLILGVTACLWAAPATPAGAQPKITWSNNAVNVHLASRGTTVIPLNFTSDVALQYVALRVVPELSPFVRLQPESFGNISAGKAQTVLLLVTVPPTTAIATYNGTIQLKDQAATSKTYAQPLSVSLTIAPANGTLPPDPGDAGKLTLAGIDTDGDGVRDDVQHYIGITYPDSAKKRAALTQMVLALEEELLGADNPSLIKDNVQKSQDAIDCSSAVWMRGDDDVVGGQKAYDAFNALQAATLNTPERIKAYFHAEGQLGPTVIRATPYAEQASHCAVDLSTLPN